MTSRDDDIDPRVRALYGRSSTAEPPAVLDDTIRAAAHRAVGSAPRAQPSTTRRLPGATRSWWSLAAAATVAAIAIGIVEMMPPDERTPAVVAPSPPPAVSHGDTSLPKPPSDSAVPPVDVAPSGSVAPAPSRPARKPEVARAIVKPPVTAPDAPAPASASPARQVESEVAEHRTTSGDAPSLHTSAGANATSEVSPRSFPAPPPAASPASSLAVDAATPSRGTAQQMTKSRGAAAEPSPVPSFDERVKAIQILVQERRYDEARRELVRLREDHPDRIDTIPPELRALLPPR